MNSKSLITLCNKFGAGRVCFLQLKTGAAIRLVDVDSAVKVKDENLIRISYSEGDTFVSALDVLCVGFVKK